jgi:hypothetical protein
MTTPAWRVTGRYYETCSCDYVCPCILEQMAVTPSKGSCTFAMAFQIEHGNYGPTTLDGVSFIVLGVTPEAMIKGNWSVGVLVDESADASQREAVTAIASGTAGGPMAALSGLIGKFLGMEAAPIRFERNGPDWSVRATTLVDMAAKPAMGINPAASAPLQLSNTGHPANDSVTLAHAVRSHVHALGVAWDDASGRNNGQYAPFAWHSA